MMQPVYTRKSNNYVWIGIIFAQMYLFIDICTVFIGKFFIEYKKAIFRILNMGWIFTFFSHNIVGMSKERKHFYIYIME